MARWASKVTSVAIARTGRIGSDFNKPSKAWTEAAVRGRNRAASLSIGVANHRLPVISGRRPMVVYSSPKHKQLNPRTTGTVVSTQPIAMGTFVTLSLDWMALSQRTISIGTILLTGANPFRDNGPREDSDSVSAKTIAAPSTIILSWTVRTFRAVTDPNVRASM